HSPATPLMADEPLRPSTNEPQKPEVQDANGDAKGPSEADARPRRRGSAPRRRAKKEDVRKDAPTPTNGAAEDVAKEAEPSAGENDGNHAAQNERQGKGNRQGNRDGGRRRD